MSHNTDFVPKYEKKIVAHIYAFAIMWVLGIAGSIRMREVIAITLIESLIGVFLLSFLVSKLVSISYKKRIEKQMKISTTELSPTKKHEKNIMHEELLLLRELEVICEKIKNKKIKEKARDIAKLANGIFHKIQKNPQLISSMNRFFNYYLPTAIKLLTKYSELEKQEVMSANIITAMEKIEQLLDTLKSALEKKLDNLYSTTILDLESDMDVLENVLQKDGFAENKMMSNIHKGE